MCTFKRRNEKTKLLWSCVQIASIYKILGTLHFLRLSFVTKNINIVHFATLQRRMFNETNDDSGKLHKRNQKANELDGIPIEVSSRRCHVELWESFFFTFIKYFAIDEHKNIHPFRSTTLSKIMKKSISVS